MAVTDTLILRSIFSLIALLVSVSSSAAVLPEDRTDILYHSYDGGGAEINGPSVLVRKQFAEKVSVWGNYYADMITNASIDVVTQGSPYTEERTETSVGIDYLHDRTILSLSATNSSENDYEANTVGFSVSQEFFGDLTTFTLNYSLGNDTVMRNGDEDLEVQFEREAEHQRFGLGLTQILTKNWIVAFNAESVVDQGFLNNPYRSVRYIGTDGLAFQAEKYPNTHNSDAFSVRSMYYLPYRAALRLEYRTYSDSWDIQASNYEIRYIHPFGDNWIVETKYRSYSQTAADFYSDLFPFESALTFRARDKELSEFSSSTIGLGISYEVPHKYISFIDKTTVNLFWDRISFDYQNFRDPRFSEGPDATHAVGEEPMYAFDADVIRFFISVWY